MVTKHEQALIALKKEIDKVGNGRFVHSLNREYMRIKDDVIKQSNETGHIYYDEQIETQIKGLAMKIGICKIS